VPTRASLVHAALAARDHFFEKEAQSATLQCLLHARKTPLLPGGMGTVLGPCAHPCATTALSPSAAPSTGLRLGWGQDRKAEPGRDLRCALVFCVSGISRIQLKTSVVWEEKSKSRRELLGMYQNSTAEYIVPCMPLVVIKWTKPML